MRVSYGVQFAFTNGGDIRSGIPSAYLPANHTLRRTTPSGPAGYAPGPPYDIVKGDPYTILPFGDVLISRPVTGIQLWAAMENGVSLIDSTCQGTAGRFPQISGFKFSFKCTNPVGSRILTLTFPNGTPIPKDSTVYSMATNDFINKGGDGYTMFVDGQGTSRDIDANLLALYIQSLPSPIAPTTDGRIVSVP